MKTFKSVVLALFGTLIEYYDYALYGFAAPTLAQAFFPKSDPTVLLLQAYGIFFAGSCSKPLGSVLFGFIGDRFGRSFALKISIFGIAVPTVCIGMLPGYQTLGWFSALLLILFRILQGIFVSGEADSARVFIFESLPKKYQCLSNSLAYCLCMLGIYFASFSFTSLFHDCNGGTTTINTADLYLFTFLPNVELISVENWRIPFLLAGIFGLFLFILRQDLKETKPFLNQINKNNKTDKTNKGWRLNITNKSAVLITLLMTGAAGGQYHFYFVFLNSYFSKILLPLEYHLSDLRTIEQSHLLLVFALCLPIAGFLADRLSHRFHLITLLKVSATFITILALINISYIQQGYLPYSIMLLTTTALSFGQANTYVAILNQFNVSERCRGTSLGHALGSMIFSGSTPFISLWIWNFFKIPSAPFYYFLILCVLSYIALIMLERRQYTSNNAFLHDTDDVMMVELMR